MDTSADPPAFDPLGGLPDPLAFPPVPSASARHDGWTPERQRRFILALAAMGVVGRAAGAVGMGAASAYRLRARAGGKGFARAWEAALAQGRDRAWDAAYDRAINGIAVPRFYRGRQVAVVRRFDYRLAPTRPDEPRCRDVRVLRAGGRAGRWRRRRGRQGRAVLLHAVP